MKSILIDYSLELLRANSVVAHYQQVQLSPPEHALNLLLIGVLVNLSVQIFGGKELLNLESPVVGERGGADD